MDPDDPKVYGINKIGERGRIFRDVTLGFPSRENLDEKDFPGVTIGDNCVLRPVTIIYSDVMAGDKNHHRIL